MIRQMLIAIAVVGALFLERARQVIADWEDAEDAARGVDSLRGVIRVALPVMYGTRAIIPRLPDFLNRHPELRVEIIMTDERQNLVADGVAKVRAFVEFLAEAVKRTRGI